MRDIGKNIRDIRLAKNLTQDQLAERLFVTRQTVSNYENGRSRPDIDTVLRIAQVQETDVNSILYGLPVPESKKAAYKRLWIALGILAGLVGLHLLIALLYETDLFLYHSLYSASRLLILPAAVFLTGWILMHVLGIFCNLKQMREQTGKICRIVLWVVVGFVLAMLLPYVIFSIVVFIEGLTKDSVNLGLDLGIFNRIAFRIFVVTYNFPFLYAILGGASWLAVMPGLSKRNQ